MGLPAPTGLPLSTSALTMTAGLPAAVVLVKTCGWLQALVFVREA